jgi:hypothetical protein
MSGGGRASNEDVCPVAEVEAAAAEAFRGLPKGFELDKRKPAEPRADAEKEAVAGFHWPERAGAPAFDI